MNYDKIIIEMLSRIQDLEDEVKALREALGAAAEESAEPKVSTGDIRAYIAERKQQARLAGEETLTLRASEIHAALKLSKRYPMVCNAMRQSMEAGDFVVHETASGYSSSLEICYRLVDAGAED